MMKMENAKKRPKVFGVLAAVAVSLTTAGSAFASTGVLAGGYRAMYDLTDVEADVSGVALNIIIDENAEYPDNSNINPEDYVNTGIVFRDVLPIDSYTQSKDESEIATQSASGNFNWNLPSDFMRTTGDFWMNYTDRIGVNGTITPAGKVLRVGIIGPSGIRYCVYASGNFACNFESYGMGTHCVYAINDNSEVVNLRGTYSVY